VSTGGSRCRAAAAPSTPAGRRTVERAEVRAAALRPVDGRPPQPVAGLGDDAFGPARGARGAEIVLHLGDEWVEARRPHEFGPTAGPKAGREVVRPLILDGQRGDRVEAAGRGRRGNGECDERDGREQREQGGQAQGCPSTAWMTRPSLPVTAPPA
jgi:hypothetical protein